MNDLEKLLNINEFTLILRLFSILSSVASIKSSRFLLFINTIPNTIQVNPITNDITILPISKKLKPISLDTNISDIP